MTDKVLPPVGTITSAPPGVLAVADLILRRGALRLGPVSFVPLLPGVL